MYESEKLNKGNCRMNSKRLIAKCITLILMNSFVLTTNVVAQIPTEIQNTDDQRIRKGEKAPQDGVFMPAYNYYQYSACCQKVDRMAESLTECNADLSRVDYNIWGDFIIPAVVGIAIGIAIGRSSVPQNMLGIRF